MNYYFDVWKKYAIFSGRSRRTEYWFFILFNFIAYVILTLIAFVLHTIILTILYDLAIIIPSLAVGVRRLHDIGRTGWWLLITIIPLVLNLLLALLLAGSGFSIVLSVVSGLVGIVGLVGVIILLVFFCKDSQPGDNMYGPNPKGVSGPSSGSMGTGASVTTPTSPTTSTPNTTPIV